MPLEFPFSKKLKTTEELEAENEHLLKESENAELQLSIAQKQALYKKLDNAGLTVKKDFGGSLSRAWRWLNKTK